jgi:membrane protein YqaA with SNARE-associated domain
MLIAGIWGFAEATLFFVVPDVWLTLIAVRRGLVPSFMACGWALAGALAGGLAMYAWGAFDPATARGVLEMIPAIDRDMIDGVRSALRDDGVAAVVFGPLKGIPYKIYAVEGPAAGVGLLAFLAVSVPARLLRFALLAALANVVSRWALGRTGPWIPTALLLGGWAVFYAVYLSVMPG